MHKLRNGSATGPGVKCGGMAGSFLMSGKYNTALGESLRREHEQPESAFGRVLGDQTWGK